MKIHNSYKRPGIVCLAIVLAASLLANFRAQATPYASGITNSGGTIYFILNEAADNVKVIFDGGGPGNTNDLGALAQGVQSFALGAHSSYAIHVSKTAATGWTKISSDSNPFCQYFSPTSVAVNRNSADLSLFGRIYVSEASAGTAAGTTRTTSDGIYIINADQSDALGRGSASSTAGITFVAGSATTEASRSPHKIEIGEDNRLYIADWSQWKGTVYSTDPDVNTSVVVLDGIGTNAATWGTVHTTINGSPWAKGSTAGGNLQLWTIDGRWPSGGFNRLLYYDIQGTALPYTQPPTSQLRTAGVPSVADVSSDLAIGPDGKFYLQNNRSTGAAGTYIADRVNIRVVDTDGLTVLWDSLQESLNIGQTEDVFSSSRGVAISPDGSKMAIIRNDTQTWLVDLVNGIPVIGSRALLNTFSAISGATTSHRRDVAFDAVGNLYAVNNSHEKLVVWSPGGNSLAVTESSGAFNIKREQAVALTVSDSLASETGPDTAEFLISRTGDPGSSLQVSYTLSGTATAGIDYTISPASPITFSPGVSGVTVTLTPIDDSEREATETCVLTVVAGDYSLVGTGTGTAMIADNDIARRYWDIDGAVSGAGGAGSPTGNWADPNWSTSEFGDVATVAWTDWSAPVFSAGADAFLDYTVTLSGATYIDGPVFEEGTATLTGGTIVLTNFDSIKVLSGATAKFDSPVAGSSGLIKDDEGSLYLNAANTYTGPTSIKAGTVLLGASDRIPNGSGVDIQGGTLDMNYYSDTVASLAASSGTTLKLFPDSTLTFGSDNANTTFAGTTPWATDTAGGGTFVKVGTGTFSITGQIGDAITASSGMLSINGSSALGTASTAPIVLGNGVILQSTSTGVGADFVPPGRTINMLGSATMRVNVASAILMVRNNSVISGPGTLTSDGGGEFRTYDVQHSFGKLIVSAGLYTAGHSTLLGYPTSFGAIPVSFTPDAITINAGASIRKAGGQNVFLDPNQGVTLTGVGSKVIRAYSGNTNSAGALVTGTFGFPGVISGTGPLTFGLPGSTDLNFNPIFVLGGNNTYSDGTTVAIGRLFVTNQTGSATGAGSVDVAAQGTLGGDGIIGGPVVMTGGHLSPGYTFYLGPVPETTVSKEVAKLTLGNGLDMSASGTKDWQLGALSVANPGTDFDQVELTGGNLVLGGSSTLNIAFTNAATAPSESEPFWQQTRQWKIISLTGGAANPGDSNFSAISGTNGITAGTFSTISDATGVTLVFTVGAPQPVSSMSVGSVSGGNITINYTGGTGSQVLLRTFDLTIPTASWDRVATNAAGGSSFVIPVGADPKAFYRIKSE